MLATCSSTPLTQCLTNCLYRVVNIIALCTCSPFNVAKSCNYVRTRAGARCTVLAQHVRRRRSTLGNNRSNNGHHGALVLSTFVAKEGAAASTNSEKHSSDRSFTTTKELTLLRSTPHAACKYACGGKINDFTQGSTKNPETPLFYGESK